MANSTTINGYNSGLDIKNIVSTLVAAEKAPKEAQLKRLESDTTAKFTGIGQLKSAISDLQTILKELNKPELFQKRSASTSDGSSPPPPRPGRPAGYLQARSDPAGQRQQGGHRVVCRWLQDHFQRNPDHQAGCRRCRCHGKRRGGRDPRRSARLAQRAAEGQGHYRQHRQQPWRRNLATGLHRQGFRRRQDVFVQGSSGLENFNIGSVGADGKLTLSQLDGTSSSSSGYITQAKNAKFSIDGLTLESPTNTVDKVINGVTFELKTVTDTNKPITISVEQDRGGVKDNIKKFVEAYNKLVGVTSELTGVTKVGDDKAPVVGALVGDSSVRNLLTTMRNEMVQPGQGTDVRMLADMGITTKKDGTLEIDDKKLDKVLKDKFESVSALFTGDTGLMKRLDDKLTPYTQTGGVLQQRLDGLQDTIKSVDTQREALNRRVEQLQDRLLKQFTAMDQLIGQLNQTSGRMAQALSSLPGLVKKS